MKIIITEDQSNFILRRLNLIDNLVKKSLKQVDPKEYNYHDYVDEIAWSSWDNMSSLEQGGTNENIDEFLDFIRENYWKQIETYYLKHI